MKGGGAARLGVGDVSRDLGAVPVLQVAVVLLGDVAGVHCTGQQLVSGQTAALELTDSQVALSAFFFFLVFSILGKNLMRCL